MLPMSDDFQTARLYVEVNHRAKDGALSSSHGAASEQDQAVMDGWASGGLVQGSNALLIEYLRRESYVMALTVLAQEGKTPEDVTPEDLMEKVRVQTLRMLDHIGQGVAEETVKRIKS